jgi:hypothetical protein
MFWDLLKVSTTCIFLKENKSSEINNLTTYKKKQQKQKLADKNKTLEREQPS